MTSFLEYQRRTAPIRDHSLIAAEVTQDGDLGRPNVYIPLSDDVARRKVELLDKCFPSQHGRDWWDEETFLGLARLRGVECRARYAEAFTCTKLVVSLSAQFEFTYAPLSLPMSARLSPGISRYCIKGARWQIPWCGDGRDNRAYGR